MTDRPDVAALAAILRDTVGYPRKPANYRKNLPDDPRKTCNLCGCELTEENWPESFRNPKGKTGAWGKQYCCSPCHSKRVVANAAKRIDFDKMAEAVLAWVEANYVPRPPEA